MSIKNELEKILEKIDIKKIQYFFKKKENKDIVNRIKEETNFLDSKASMGERLYCILNNIHSNQLCENCKIKQVKFQWLSVGYSRYCGYKCSANNKNTKLKKEKTNLKKYGSKYVGQVKEFKDKIKQTNIDRYGVEYPSMNKDIIKKRENNNLKKYGVKHVTQLESSKQKSIITNLKKYGHKYPTQSKIIQNKIKDTNIKRYGVEYGLGSDKIKNKIKQTNIDRYGSTSPLGNNKVQDKIKNTNIKRYGVENVSQSIIIKEKANKTKIKRYNNGEILGTTSATNKYNEIGKKYNVEIFFKDGFYNIKCNNCNNITLKKHTFIYNRLYKYNITPCIKCCPESNFISGIEQNFYNYLRKIYDGQIIQSNRTILNGKEIDLLLEEIGIGIEINGLYWHSDINKEEKNYHINKTRLAKEKGIQLFHIFEDEIKQGMELIYSIISGKGKLNKILDIKQINKDFGLNLNKEEKIYGRKLKLISLYSGNIEKKKEYKELLEKNHIQGKDNAKYYYGLEDNNGKVYSIMTFKKMSVDKNQQKSNNSNIENNIYITFELSRYVTIPGIQIVGGFSKLLKAFKKEIYIEFPEKNIKLITYSNLRYSKEENNVYIRNGFKNLGFTGINYYYIYKGEKFHRFKFRKDQLYYKYLPENNIPVDPDYKKESEKGMIKRLNDNSININKIYDCGHIKWELYI